MIYDEYCYKLNCKNYIEWEYDDGGSDQPYICISCMAQGQSHEIYAIADDCPHKEILQQEEKNIKST